MKTFVLKLDVNRRLTLGTIESQSAASISLRDPSKSVTTENNLLAYRPNYGDFHNSGLGAIFVNIEGVFPSIAGTSFPPICSLFTREEDGFRKGQQFVELGDARINGPSKIFGNGISTYGLAVQGCPELNKECLPTYFESEVVCLLPRSECIAVNKIMN